MLQAQLDPEKGAGNEDPREPGGGGCCALGGLSLAGLLNSLAVATAFP